MNYKKSQEMLYPLFSCKNKYLKKVWAYPTPLTIRVDIRGKHGLMIEDSDWLMMVKSPSSRDGIYLHFKLRWCHVSRVASLDLIFK